MEGRPGLMWDSKATKSMKSDKGHEALKEYGKLNKCGMSSYEFLIIFSSGYMSFFKLKKNNDIKIWTENYNNGNYILNKLKKIKFLISCSIFCIVTF